MSRMIEEQVVKLQFDNKGFESGVQESLSSLEKFKLALGNITGKKSVDLDTNSANTGLMHLTGTIETVRQKFSALEFIAIGALTKIGSQAVTTGEHLIKSLSIDNVTAGWSKYEEKTNNVQSLINSTGKSIDEINGYLDQLMWYSDETSFGFTDMTSALTTMVASGGDIDKLIPMIEGMGNATAFAGKSASEFSRVIYNLNQSYSTGALKTQDWRSVELAGVGSKQLKQYLMEAAEEVGTIEKGTSDLAQWSEYLSRGMITSEAMEIAFRRFGAYTEAVKEAVDNGTYKNATEAMENMATDGFEAVAVSAFEAAQNYKSFSEAVDATKDAVSSGWLVTFETIFGNMEEAKEIWTSVGDSFWELFASGADSRNEFLSQVFNSPIESLGEELESCSIKADVLETALKGIAESKGLDTNEIIETYGTFSNWISKCENGVEWFKEALANITGTATKFSKSTEVTTQKLEDFQKVVNKVINGDFKTGTERIKSLTEAGYNATAVQKLVNKVYERGNNTWSDTTITLDDLSSVLGELSEEELQSIGYTEEQAEALKQLAEEAEKTGTPLNELIERLNRPSGRELFFSIVSTSLENLVTLVNLVKQSFSDIFSFGTAESWYNILDAVNNACISVQEFLEAEENTEEGAHRLSRAFKGVFAVLKIITTFFTGTFGLVFRIVKQVASAFGTDLLTVLAKIGDKLVAFSEWINNLKIFEVVGNAIALVLSKIIDIVKKSKGVFTSAFDKINSILEKIGDNIPKLVDWFKELFASMSEMPILSTMAEDVKSAFSKVSSSVGTATDKTKNFFKTIDKKKVVDSINTALTRLRKVFVNFKTSIVSLGTSVKGFFSDVKSGKTITDSFKDNFAGIVEFFTKLKDTVTGFFETIFGSGDENKFKKLGDTIHDFFTGLDSDKVTAIVLTTIFGLFAINLLRLTNALSDTVTAIGGTFTTLKTVINSYMKRQKSVILQIAEAIVIVAGALYILSKIPEDEMRNAMSALLVIAGAIGVLAVIMTAATKISNAALPDKRKLSFFSETAFALIGISATMVALAFSLKGLSKMEIGVDILPKIGLCVAIIGVLALIVTALSKAQSKIKGGGTGLVKTAITMLGVAAAMLILAKALGKISEVTGDGETLTAAMNAMLKMMIGLAAISLAAGSIGGFSALGILAVVLLFEKLMPKIENIVNYDYTSIQKGLDSNKEMLKSIGTIVGIGLVIGGLFGKGFSKFGTGLIKLAGVLLILLLIAKYASRLKTTDISKGMGFLEELVNMISQLILCMALYNKFSKMFDNQKGGGSGFGMFAGIAIALVAMTLIVKSVKNLDKNQIDKGLKFITSLSLLVDTMLFVASLAGKGDGSSFKSLALVLAGISFILGLMVTLSIIKDKNSLYAAMAAIATVLLSLGAVFAAVGKLNSEATKNAKGMSKKGVQSGPILAVLATIATVVAGIVWLSKQPVNNIVAAGASLLTAMVGLTILIKGLSKTVSEAEKVKNKNWASVIQAIILLAAVSAAIGLLAAKGKDAKSMVSASGAITIGLVGLSACIKSLQSVGNKAGKCDFKKMAGILGGAIASLIVVSAAIWTLSNYGGNPESMVAAAVAITVGMVGVGIASVAMGWAGDICKDSNALTMGEVIVGAIGALAVVAGAIKSLSNYDGDSKKMIDSALAIGVGAIAVGVAAILMGTAGRIAKNANAGTAAEAIGGAMASILVVGAVILGLGKWLTPEEAATASSLVEPITILLGAVSAMMVVIAITAKILGDNAPSPGPILEVFGIAILVITALAALAWGLGEALMNIDSMREAISVGLDCLVEIFTKVGDALGGFIGGFISTLSSEVIEGIGTSLNTLMDDDHLGGFLKKVEEVPEGAVDGAMALAGVVAAWIGVSWMQFFSSLFGVNVEEFDFAAVGKMVCDFTNSVKDLSASDITTSQRASKVALALSEFANSLPTSGGLKSLVFGDTQSIKEFSEGMTEFASGIISLASTSRSFTNKDAEDIDRVINSADSLNVFSKSFQTYGGLKGLILGDKQTISEFSSSIVDFILAVKTVVSNIRVLKTSYPDYANLIDDLTLSVEPLNDLSKALDTSGWSVKSAIEGRSDFKSFTKNILDFVKDYRKLLDYISENLSGDISTPITNFTNSLDPFVELTKTLGEQDISYKPIKNLSEAVKNLSSANIGAMAGSFKNDTSVVSALDSFLERIKKKVDDKTESTIKLFSDLANDCIKGIGDAFSKGYDIISPALASFVSLIHAKLSEVASSSAFEIYGTNVAQGLANGINSAAHVAVEAAKKMAEDVAKYTAKALDEHSPSKLSNKLGRFWDLGLANGIDEETGTVIKSTESLADEVVESTNNVIKSVVDAMSTDVDFQPTIRPVIDMEDVDKKSKAINDALSFDDAVSSNVTSMFSSKNLDLVRKVSSHFAAGAESGLSKDTVKGDAQNNISFVQNNYSPKALSRIDIYRQTNNQISSLRSALS